MSIFTLFRQLQAQGQTPAEDYLTTDGHRRLQPNDDAGDDHRARLPPPYDDAGDDHRRRRPLVAPVVTALACLLVLFALLAPNQLGHLTPGAFVRIPVEGLVGVALVLVLPARSGRVAAAIIGVALGLLTIVKIIDIGFYAVVDRPFDPVLDWTLFGNAMDYLAESVSRVAAVCIAIGAVVLAVAVLALITLSVLRLTRIVVRHRTRAAGFVSVLGAFWVACALLGVQLVPGEPVAAMSAATLAYDRTLLVRASLHDQEAFAKELAADPFRDTPSDQLLSALRGKDVILAFVESYGRSAVEDPTIASGVDAVLDAGTRRLRAAGFASQSAWLRSPTAGGSSWLAHSTLLSGTWVNNQRRYNDLLTSDRLTLTGAFQRAKWRTVAVLPGTTRAWPQGSFYGYDKIYAAHDLGYRGPSFSWAPMPDQYALSAFQRSELATPHHAPVMAQMALVSSHAPWAPIPSLISWQDVGDGSVFDPMPAAGKQPADVWRDASRVRTEYGRSIQYSLNSLISYVETYGTKNTVLVFLGDHQPAAVVTGAGASRDVPITIVAHDPAVLKQISGWGWQDGLKPGSRAPVWPMNTFRDQFLTAFSPAAK